MPGLFDSIAPFLSGLRGGVLGSIGSGLQNAQNYNTLSQQVGPGDAGLALSAPQAFGLGFQRQMFLQQYQDWAKTHPGGDFNQFLYETSPEGLKGQYGSPTPVQGYEFGPYKSPGFISHGQVQPPPGFPGTQPSGTTGVQGQPSQQSQGGQNPLPPVAQSVLEYERQLASNKAKGEEEGAAQTTVGGTVAQIDRSLALIDDISKDPNMKWATGLFGAVPPVPGTGPYGFSKKVDQLKEQLVLDLLPSLQRKGSRVSPALTEMLQKSTAGQELDRSSPDFAKSLQNTRDALVQIRGATQGQANVPVTQAPAQEADSYEGRTVTNKKTGQKGIIKNGQLVPLPQGPQL